MPAGGRASAASDPAAVLAEQARATSAIAPARTSPMQAAPDAVTLDTSGITVAEVVARIAGLARGV